MPPAASERSVTCQGGSQCDFGSRGTWSWLSGTRIGEAKKPGPAALDDPEADIWEEDVSQHQEVQDDPWLPEAPCTNTATIASDSPNVRSDAFAGDAGLSVEQLAAWRLAEQKLRLCKAIHRPSRSGQSDSRCLLVNARDAVDGYIPCQNFTGYVSDF